MSRPSALPVLTAVSDATFESGLVSAFDRRDLGVVVVRRCVDLADLLAAAATGTARAVLLSADLRRLDRDALVRLAAAGLAVVGLTDPGDEHAERRLRQLGLEHVLPADAGADLVGATLVQAVGALGDVRERLGRAAFGDPAAALPLGPANPGDGGDAGDGGDGGEGGDVPFERGTVVAVWGPTGAPGRTTVAITLAAEYAALGVSTLLIDADSYGGAVAQILGLLEEAPGLAAAARAANNGSLDVPALAALARDVGGGLRVLPGIVRPDRWPELRPSSLEVVLSLARRLAAVTVVDCGFCLEADEEVSFDTLAPRRNGATLEVLAAADTILAVGSADPVGLQRLVRGLSALREAVPDAPVAEVVLNRVRRSAAPGDPVRAATAAVLRHTGLGVAATIPLDVAGLDAAVAAGRPLHETSPASPARLAIAGLAARAVGAPVPTGRRRLLRR